MTTPRVGDIGPNYGSGGANSAPSGATGTPSYREVAVALLSAVSPQFDDTTAMEAGLTVDRVDGQVALRVSDYTLWVWKDADATAADATHIAPTDLDGGAGRWVALATTPVTAATTVAAGTMSAADKKFLDGTHGSAVAMTDAAENLVVGTSRWWTTPTLTGNRVKTLQTTGAVAGDQVTVTRTTTDAFTLAVANGGGGGGTLVTFPVSKVASAVFQFDGTDWALRSVGQLA